MKPLSRQDAATGLLADDKIAYHTAPVPLLRHKGRLWRGMETMSGGFRAFVMSAPLDADLLRALEARERHDVVVQAQASPVFTLGGDARLAPPPRPFPWLQAALWAVLLAGVLLLAWMVRGLLRQLKAPDG